MKPGRPPIAPVLPIAVPEIFGTPQWQISSAGRAKELRLTPKALQSILSEDDIMPGRDAIHGLQITREGEALSARR
jgi:hypothetical protein